MEETKKGNFKGFKIFIAIFLLLSLFLLREENQERLIGLLGGRGEKTLKLIEAFESTDDLLDIKLDGGNIIRWKNNNISISKPDNTLILEKEFNFIDPFLYFGEKHIYIADKSSGDIYLLNNKGETIDRLQLNREIFNIKESKENFIYHTKDLEEEVIRVLNKDGVLIGSYIYKDKNVLSYVTNKDSTITALSLLKLGENLLKSEVELYGENNEKLNSLGIEGEILLFIEFVSKEDLIGLTDKSLYYIKDGRTMWRRQFDLIKDIEIYKEKIYILYSNYLEIIDLEGRTEEKIGFTNEYKNILLYDRKILLYGENSLVILDNGKEILKHSESIKDVSVNKNKVLIWTPEKVKLYEITNKK